MIKKIFYILILSMMFINVYCEPECKSALECIENAMEMIKKDRQEINLIQYKIDNLVISLDKKLNDKINEIKNELISIVSQVTNQTKTDNITQKITDDFSSIKNEFNEMKKTVESKNYIYRDAIIHHNIITALETGVISKSGNPNGWDESSYRANFWNGRRMISIGSNAQANEHGLKTTIPEAFNVLWLRVHNDDWNIFRIMYTDGNKEQIPKFTAGQRSLTELSPDGGAPDSFNRKHIWVPIPVPRPGSIVIHSDHNQQHWISGIAFGKNLWGHAKNSALAYHWAVNGGTKLNWESQNWNDDILAKIPYGTFSEIYVPVVSNGKDKLLYIIEHNNIWNGIFHTAVYANGIKIERFRTTYVNQFSMHYNSKIYNRYLAAKIPKELINAGDTLVLIKIDMTMQNSEIYIREIGTHDLI